MIYELSLRDAGLLAGIFLLLIAAPALLQPGRMRSLATKLPRSRATGVILFTIAFAWSMWLLATMEMGEFSGFRRPLLIGLPIGYLLVLRFVAEFLAVRALGILCLLAAEPLLEAAFLRYEACRLFVTVFAYVLIVAGIFWVTMPYLLRDQIGWAARSTGRWLSLHAIVLVYGVTVLALAIREY